MDWLTSIEQIPTVNDAGLFITTETYARCAGLDHATVCRQCREGVIKAVRVGKKWRIPMNWVREQWG